MTFMILEIFLEKKTNFYLILPFFVYLQPDLINERSNTTFSMFEGSVMKHFLGPKYSFTSSKAFSGKFYLILWLLSIRFVFRNRIKICYRQVLMLFIEALAIFNLWDILDDFYLFSLL